MDSLTGDGQARWTTTQRACSISQPIPDGTVQEKKNIGADVIRITALNESTQY
jgi:hypothetical protein